MEMFEYVAVLTSIIAGLGIANLLQGLARLIQHPGQDRVYWVHLGWVLYTFLYVVHWWWFEFRLGSVEVWTIQLYWFLVLYAVALYLECALLFPASLADYDGFREYFYSRRGWFFGLWALIGALDVGDSWLKGGEHLSSLGSNYLVGQGIFLALFLVAARTRNERFHAALVIACVANLTLWALTSYETVL